MKFWFNGSQLFKAALVAVVPALVTIVMKQEGLQDWLPSSLFPEDDNVYTSLSWVLGFILVFRTGQAYNRFWDGATLLHRMGSEWYDACAQITAFAEASDKDRESVETFHINIVRLFSLLHCSALQQITAVSDDEIDVIDPAGIGHERIRYLRKSKDSRQRTEVVLQWIQKEILGAMKSGVIQTPPPIVSRSFQELNSGMIALAGMQTIADIPIPVPYHRMLRVLLQTHFVLTPFFVVALTKHYIWSGIFAFTAVFSMWVIHFIAAEIEHPFGDKLNNLDFPASQSEMNASLLSLLEPLMQGRDTTVERTTHTNGEQSQTHDKGEESNASGPKSILHKSATASTPTVNTAQWNPDAQLNTGRVSHLVTSKDSTGMGSVTFSGVSARNNGGAPASKLKGLVQNVMRRKGLFGLGGGAAINVEELQKGKGKRRSTEVSARNILKGGLDASTRSSMMSNDSEPRSDSSDNSDLEDDNVGNRKSARLSTTSIGSAMKANKSSSKVRSKKQSSDNTGEYVLKVKSGGGTQVVHARSSDPNVAAQSSEQSQQQPSQQSQEQTSKVASPSEAASPEMGHTKSAAAMVPTKSAAALLAEKPRASMRVLDDMLAGDMLAELQDNEKSKQSQHQPVRSQQSLQQNSRPSQPPNSRLTSPGSPALHSMLAVDRVSTAQTKGVNQITTVKSGKINDMDAMAGGAVSSTAAPSAVTKAPSKIRMSTIAPLGEDSGADNTPTNQDSVKNSPSMPQLQRLGQGEH